MIKATIVACVAFLTSAASLRGGFLTPTSARKLTNPIACNDMCQATLSQCGGKCMQLPPGDQSSSCMTQCSTASFTCSAACDSRKLSAGAEENVERDEVEAFLAAAAKASGLTEGQVYNAVGTSDNADANKIMDPAVQRKIDNALKDIKAVSLADAWHTGINDASSGLGDKEKQAAAKLSADMEATFDTLAASATHSTAQAVKLEMVRLKLSGNKLVPKRGSVKLSPLGKELESKYPTQIAPELAVVAAESHEKAYDALLSHDELLAILPNAPSNRRN
jgi:predicted transglutaminase-like cysteine proteinase